MLKRCVFLFLVGLSINGVVWSSDGFDHRWYDALCERDQQMCAFVRSDLNGESIRTAMESSELSLAEEQQTLEELQEAAQGSGEDSKPLSKKQRRLQYVNELLSHNSDLKKQSLIKVINNLNKCGVECTLSTQGKGSHITLSVDGKKHTISSKMQMTHLRDALSDSGVQFSVIEDDNAQSESDQIIQDQTLKVDELTQLLNSLGVDLAELEKEKEKLEEDLVEQQESVDEIFEALLFSKALKMTLVMIIHRSFGRREMIWQIYDAVLADLPHFGPQLDFQRELKKRLISEQEKWGCVAPPFPSINKCSTSALEKLLNYWDGLGSMVSKGKIDARTMPVARLLDGITVEVFSLDITELIDFPDLYDWNRVPNSILSFQEKHQRNPYLSEFKSIMDGLRIPEHYSGKKSTFDTMNLILLLSKQNQKKRLPKHEMTMRLTQKNPNDEDWYYQKTKDNHWFEFSSDELMKISELYDRCNCKMAEAWFDLASATLQNIVERDQDKAVLFIERMLDQTPFRNQCPQMTFLFMENRRNCAQRLYNQSIREVQSQVDSGYLSEQPLIDIDRAERISVDGWFDDDNSDQKHLYLSYVCMQYGFHERVARYYGRVTNPARIHRNFPGKMVDLGFDPKSEEVSRERQKWETKVKKHKKKAREEGILELVVRAEVQVNIAKKCWDKRDELDLEQIEHNYQQLRAVRNKIKDCVECAIDHPDLLRELKDKDELYQKCVAFKKGEHSPKKKKTQKRGKRGKH